MYSKRKLTKSSDKLVAVSEIARASSEIGAGQMYHAGMWSVNLELQLCWRAIIGSKRYAEYIAPSWSWTSVEGAINMSNLTDDYCMLSARVHSVSTTLVVEEDLFGAVSAGMLVLDCKHIFRTRLRCTKEEGWIRKSFPISERITNQEIYIDDATQLDFEHGDTVYLVLIILKDPEYSYWLIFRKTSPNLDSFIESGSAKCSLSGLRR